MILGEYSSPSNRYGSNTLPVANAGEDQSNILAGETFTLDGSGSLDGVGGSIVSYQWTQLSGDPVTLGDSTAVITTATAPSSNNPQTLTFQLLVTDNEGETDTNSTNVGVVDVQADTTPPVITVSGSASQTLTVGDAVPVFTYSMTDNVDGVITDRVEVTGDDINNLVPGVYVKRFNGDDLSGNDAIEVTRTVIYQETPIDVNAPARTIDFITELNQYWSPDKSPDDSDYYAVLVNSDWLGAGTVELANLEVDESTGLILSDPIITANEIRFRLSAGNIGTHKVLITVRSSGRTRQETGFVVVRER
jgi:hypothetical protein